jgi:hypothetical protein
LPNSPSGVPMSNADTRRGRKPYAGIVKTSVSEPGDERQGDYSREQLVRFDNRFRARLLLRAFETGAESREAAAAMNGANASRPR